MLNRLKIKPSLFLILFTFCYMLFATPNTSPLFNLVGYDSGMFLLMGKNLAKGGTLYIDLFDHKGPIIFFINGIIQALIPGTLGVWIIEVCFMVASVLLLYAIGKKMLPSSFHALLVPLSYLACMLVCFEDGNFTEEYNNLFSIICLFIFTQFITSSEKVLSHTPPIVLGVCFALTFFTRPNNTALILAVILFIGLYALRFTLREVPRYLLEGLLGILIVLLPLMGYHLMEHNLMEMFNALILHNLKYSHGNSTNLLSTFFIPSQFKILLFIIYSVIAFANLCLIRHKQYTYALFVTLAMVISFISISFSGNEYSHYLMIAAPLFALSMLFIIKYPIGAIDNVLKHFPHLTLGTSFVFVALLTGLSTYSLFHHGLLDYRQHATTLGRLIPSTEKDSVLGYNQDAKWFYMNDLMPCFTYFTLQDWMASSDPTILSKLEAFIQNTPPKWLVTPDINSAGSPIIKDYVLAHYTLVSQNASGMLYKLIK